MTVSIRPCAYGRAHTAVRIRPCAYGRAHTAVRIRPCAYGRAHTAGGSTRSSCSAGDPHAMRRCIGVQAHYGWAAAWVPSGGAAPAAQSWPPRQRVRRRAR
eukprot:1919423-Prymnesium_polylepis.1